MRWKLRETNGSNMSMRRHTKGNMEEGVGVNQVKWSEFGTVRMAWVRWNELGGVGWMKLISWVSRLHSPL